MKFSLRTVLLRDRMMMSRFGLAVASLLWSFQLALPVHLFPTPTQIASGTGRQTYALMASLAPEWIWAIGFGVHGVMALYSLIVNERTKINLMLDGFLGCFVWTTSTVACFAAHWPIGQASILAGLLNYPPPAAMSADIIMSFYAWWHMIRFWAEESCESGNPPIVPQTGEQPTWPGPPLK